MPSNPRVVDDGRGGVACGIETETVTIVGVVRVGVCTMRHGDDGAGGVRITRHARGEDVGVVAMDT